MRNAMPYKTITSAILLALAQMSVAYAADTAPPATTDASPVGTTAAVDATQSVPDVSKDAQPLNLDKIVVTGTPRKISKMNSSISVSTMDATQIQNSGATNAAEVLRSIPGVRSESSGGESNANMTVRGLPISAGGARYVQMQEDGLPILQFGDVAFATPDTFYRVDQSLDKLEVVRGGSGSTLATNSPGGLINFISKTGEVEGGKVGLSTGINFKEVRGDFSYGAHINDGLRYFVSGFERQGAGLRDPGFNIEKGGQIKGNITKDLENGFVRLSFKHLDDQTPTNQPLPSNGVISPAGVNPSTGTLYGKNWPTDVTLGTNNQLVSSNVSDGLKVKTDSIGAELGLDMGGWALSDKFRWADNTGRFIALFPSSPVAANGSFSAVVFNTSLNDMGNTANDLNVSKVIDNGEGGKLTPRVGLYTSLQNVALTWSFNSYTLNTNNNTATFLNNSLATFGGCCTRDINAKYRTTSPYASLGWEIDKWNVDASVRQDKQDATGYYNTATNTGATTAGGGTFNPATASAINYSINHTSYSAGANYRVDSNLALFGRVSDGVAFNADRIMFGTAKLNGGVIPVNQVTQYEAGAKWRQGNLSTFVTVFDAKTDESNYDATTQISTHNKYDAKGVELEGGYAFDDFRLGGGVTYTDAKIVSPAPAAGANATPNRQAKFVYQLTPSYRVNNDLNLAASVIGTTSSTDSSTINMPAYTVFNLVARYDYTKRMQFTFSANNLFNRVGYTEAQANAARSIDGRSLRAAAVYSF